MKNKGGAKAPKQNRSVGHLLRFTAVIVALVIFGVGAYIISFYDNAGRSMFALLALSGASGAVIWNRGSQHLVALGEEVLKTDKRPPIIYLRSFANEANVSQSEMAFGKMFQDIGPLIAIGAPGEKLPALGAARLYLEDNNWQMVISDLIARAQLVIMYGGVTPGLGWEVNHVKTHMNPTRTVIMVPNDKNYYQQFRALAKAEANLDLPSFPPKRDRKYAITGSVGFVTFDAHWRPKFIKMPKAGNRGMGSLFDESKESGRAWAALAKICHDAGIKVPKPPRNWFLTIYGVIKIYLIIVLSIVAVLVALYFANILHIDDQAGPYFIWPTEFLDFFQNVQSMFQNAQKRKGA